MDFQKYLDNLENQLKAVNADILEKQEELEKLKDFRSRVRGGIEVVKQIQGDVPSTPQDVKQAVQDMLKHGGDMDAL